MVLQVIQLFTQGYDNNFSYLVYDEQSKEALVVDPCGDISLITKAVDKHQLLLKFIVNTHGHFDHVEKNKEIKQLYQCNQCSILIHESESFAAESFLFDRKLKHNEVIFLGKEEVKVLHTPGHTLGSICLYFSNQENKYLITGDTLFVNTVGRMDFAGGSKEQMYESLYNKILSLDPSTLILPGHDYGLMRMDTLEGQKATNPFLKCKSKSEFMGRF